MANIKIFDIVVPGLDLFKDSESFLKELDNHELSLLGGGLTLPSILINITPDGDPGTWVITLPGPVTLPVTITIAS
jgi:hypothetical protein